MRHIEEFLNSEELTQAMDALLAGVGWKDPDGTYNGHDTNVGDLMDEKGSFKSFLSSSLHQLAEVQKEKALEIVRGMKQADTGDKADPFFSEPRAYNQALSEVEEAITKEL